MKQKILGFTGEYRWLSNFPSCKIEMDGVVYPSPENAYQAFKTLDPEERKQFLKIRSFEAKKLGTTVKLRDDWEAIKLDVMLKVQRKKYAQEPFRTWLLDTGDAYIEETNHWGDVYWGVCNGVGENHLGKIIMQVRSELILSDANIHDVLDRSR
jgi:ribA/ribD-fused uncharacterized protein